MLPSIRLHCLGFLFSKLEEPQAHFSTLPKTTNLQSFNHSIHTFVLNPPFSSSVTNLAFSFTTSARAVIFLPEISPSPLVRVITADLAVIFHLIALQFTIVPRPFHLSHST